MTLLIVDDHPIVLEGMEAVLSRRGYKVLKATTAPQALSLAEHVPDIEMFVIDLSLVEGTDGLSLVEELRAAGIQKPVIVYTMHEELWNISTLLKSDVEGIVLKGDNIRELEDAIEQVAKGRKYRSSSFSKCCEEVSKTKGILSQKDIEVLRRLSKGEGNRGISEAMFMSEKSIEYHRGNILRKMCAKTMAEAVQRAIKLGIICLAALSFFQTEAQERAFTVPQGVDLGLSVMWGDRNLGASSPLESGYFYAFAEVAPKDKYDWTTYRYCSDANLFLQHDLGLDDCCISGTEYDAAYVALGKGWRFPTAAECRELLDNTKREYGEEDGVKYVVLSASDGSSIKLPYAGYMNGGKLVYEGKNVCLWSGSFYVESGEEDGFKYYLNAPYYMVFDKESAADVFEGSSHLGFPVRPVFDPRQAGIHPVPGLDDSRSVEGIYTVDGRSCGVSAEGLPRGLYIIRYTDGTASKVMF